MLYQIKIKNSMENKEKITLKNIFYFIQGHIRYELYYSKFVWLIRNHIREQIEARINSMNKECYNQGSCIKCGCKTTHLQMSNKACKGLCYPSMMNKRKWNLLKNKKIVVRDSKVWMLRNFKFKKFDK